MDFEEAGAVATGGLAAVVVAGDHIAAGAWWDGIGVALAWATDGGVAAHAGGFGAAQLAFAGIGLDGHAAGCGFFVDVDLDRWS